MALLQILACFCLCQVLPTFAYGITKKCTPNEVVLRNLENQYGVRISNLYMSIAFDRLDILLSKSLIQNTSEIFLHSANIVFEGNWYPRERYTYKKIERSYNADSVIMQVTEDTEQKRLSCRTLGGQYPIKGLAKSKGKLTAEERIEFALHDLTEICLEIQICDHLNSILYEIEKESEESESNSNTQPPHTRHMAIFRNEHEKTLQKALNAIFDFGLSAALSQVVDGKGLFHLPEIKMDFTAAGSTGGFMAKNGIIEGLPTTKRIRDVYLVNDKNHYTMGTTINLSKAKLHFPSYYGRYGIINIYGHVIVDIRGISLTTKVSIDYNSMPCKIYLNEMKVHDLGTINVDISGLGWPLNGILQSVLRNVIKVSVFEKAKDTISEKAKLFDCEKYRPSIKRL